MRCLLALAVLVGGCAAPPSAGRAPERIRVSPDGRSFVFEVSGKPFVPWGFNYDHDERGRLIEDYWDAEWAKVDKDFREMKKLGANVVRVHLQLGQFMNSAEEANPRALARLGDLLGLCEILGLFLDLTGLGCYHKKDVPAWYDDLDEDGRWTVQARFWTAVAAAGAKSSSVFCYDLMNEPIVPAGKNAPGQWLGPPFGDKHFVQWITLHVAGRKREDIARLWCRKLTTAVRAVDPHHLVSVGLVDWSLDRPGSLYSGFRPEAVAPELDFLCVHLYPKAEKVDDALVTLEGFRAANRPVVIEETFLLGCGVRDFEAFLDRTRGRAAGWIGFYWGRTLEECRKSSESADALMAQWLEIFRRKAP